MIVATYRKRSAYLVLEIVGLVFAVGYLGLSIRLPFGRLDRPGAGVFPVFVGLVLIGASLATIWEGWRMNVGEHIDLPAGADRNRVLILVGLLFGYFFLLPWLGQIATSAIFSVLLMRILCELSWVRIVAYSAIMAVVIDLVFVVLLKVPLPRGILGI